MNLCDIYHFTDCRATAILSVFLKNGGSLLEQTVLSLLIIPSALLISVIMIS
jgi:hypothetical protein